MKVFKISATKSMDFFTQFTSEDMKEDGFDCPKEYSYYLMWLCIIF